MPNPNPNPNPNPTPNLKPDQVLAGGVVYFVMKRRGNVAANTAVTLEGVVAGAPDDDEVGKQFVGPPHARAAAAAKTDKHDFV